MARRGYLGGVGGRSRGRSTATNGCYSADKEQGMASTIF